jgi:hypothetical protein
MRNDSIETLLLRHYGSNAPAPDDLEEHLRVMVRNETRAESIRQRKWEQQRVSRRRVLQLVTFTSAGVSTLAIGINTLQGTPRKHAFSV